MHRHLINFAWILSLALTTCGEADEAALADIPTTAASAPLRGYEDVNDDFSASGFLLGKVPGWLRQSHNCSGTLIGEDAILTSAACAQANLMGFTTGDGMDVTGRQVSHVVLHPEHQAAQHDIAILFLQKLMLGISIAGTATSGDNVDSVTDVTVAGNGVYKMQTLGFLQRRLEAKRRLSEGRVTNMAATTFDVELPGENQFCEGDEGGAAYGPGQLVIGVQSTRDPLAVSQPVDLAKRCVSRAMFVRVDAHQAWIDATLATSGSDVRLTHK